MGAALLGRKLKAGLKQLQRRRIISAVLRGGVPGEVVEIRPRIERDGFRKPVLQRTLERKLTRIHAGLQLLRQSFVRLL